MIVGSGRNARRIRIRAVHRDPPDLQLLAQALVGLARDISEDERKRLDSR